MRRVVWRMRQSDSKPTLGADCGAEPLTAAAAATATAFCTAAAILTPAALDAVSLAATFAAAACHTVALDASRREPAASCSTTSAGDMGGARAAKLLVGRARLRRGRLSKG